MLFADARIRVLVDRPLSDSQADNLGERFGAEVEAILDEALDYAKARIEEALKSYGGKSLFRVETEV